ncbi:hypothetical protein BV20DRAFT_962915 [Pilatotrama ljubarskyi]|nr:hypothetical protein BV20DRAFT_962915 [Pilatotrama ljubarskyi]
MPMVVAARTDASKSTSAQSPAVDNFSEPELPLPPPGADDDYSARGGDIAEAEPSPSSSSSPPPDTDEEASHQGLQDSTNDIALNDATSPIHRLPPEVLMQILYNARYRLRDIRLAHVCRRWRETILAMPEFWAAMLRHFELQSHDIRVGRGIYDEFLEQCLALSTPRMIKLRLFFSGEPERRALAQHLWRVTELRVSVARSEAAVALLRLLRESDLPNLTALCYQPNAAEIPPVVLPMERLAIRSLTRLDVPASSLAVPCAITSQLQYLVLRGLSKERLRLIDVLNSCAALTSLTLRGVGIHWPQLQPDSLPPASETIHLPALRELSIFDTDLGARNVLARLAVPSTVHMHVSSSYWPRCGFEIDEFFAAPTLLTRDVLPAIKRLYLGRRTRKGPVLLVGYAKDGTERLVLSLWRDYNGEKILEDILGPWTNSEVTTLTINLPRLPLYWKANQYTRRTLLDSVRPPRQLTRLELLGNTPPDIKRLFVGWILR